MSRGAERKTDHGRGRETEDVVCPRSTEEEASVLTEDDDEMKNGIDGNLCEEVASVACTTEEVNAVSVRTVNATAEVSSERTDGQNGNVDVSELPDRSSGVPQKSALKKKVIVSIDEEENEVKEKAEKFEGLYRLFTDAELDAMEACVPVQEGTVLAGLEVAVEEEEYEKELEDRLYPLDEVELKKRMKLKAETSKEPSLEDMASFLKIPVEVLRRNEAGSLGTVSSPGYWKRWFEDALEVSVEAKKANRDFRELASGHARPGSAKAVCAEPDLPLVGAEAEGEVSDDEDDSIVLEENVCANIEVPLEESNEDVRPSSVSGGSLALIGRRKDRSAGIRTVGRLAVYRMLKEQKENARLKHGNDGALEDEAEALKLVSWQDELPKLNWDRLHWHADRVVAEHGFPGDVWIRLMGWTQDYSTENAPRIWKELCERIGKPSASRPSRRKWRRAQRRLCFNCSSLYGNRVEAVGERSFRPKSDDDVTHCVNRMGTVRPSRRDVPKSGLMEVVTVDLPDGFGVRDDGTDYELPVVEGGWRGVCSVGNLEALHGGYIDCLPSQLLADTGATLSLVDRRVLKRLGRSAEPLKPYGGRVQSSSGHPLRIRGCINLPLRLGSVELDRPVLVTDGFHVNAILGVDALGTFRAVINVEERTMTLKGTSEVLQLGVSVVHETFMTNMATSAVYLLEDKRW